MRLALVVPPAALALALLLPAPAPAAPADPAPSRVGPEGGVLLPLGTGSVQAEVVHDAAAGRLLVVLRDRKDGSRVPVAQPPVAYVLDAAGKGTRVELTAQETGVNGRWARWGATSDAFRASPLQAVLRLRIADAPYETNLGTYDVRALDPPIEERISLHGGRVIVFGEGSFHGELIHDPAAGTVSVWFLEPRDKTAIPLNDAPVAEVESGGRVVVVTLEPVFDHLDAVRKSTGKTDLWRATHPALRTEPLRGRMITYIADRPYSAPLSPLIGRRGGRIVTLADGVRAELVHDRAGGAVTVYVLDSPTPGTILADAPRVVRVRREPGPSAAAAPELVLVPVPGRAGAYRLVNEALRAPDAAALLRFRVGPRTFEEQVDPDTGTPAPGTPADQDAIPGDHDPGSKREDAPQTDPAPPSDSDAIPGDSDPGSAGGR